MYNAPLDTVWDFIQKDEVFHPKAHSKTLRNMKAEPLSDLSMLLSYETRDESSGRWTKFVSRMTEIRPAVRVLERIEGPNAGTTTVHLYTPKGGRTIVDVLVYLHSAPGSAAKDKQKMLNTFANAYKEDIPFFQEFAKAHRASTPAK